MSEGQAQTSMAPRAPVVEIVQRVRGRFMGPTVPGSTQTVQQGPVLTIIQRFRSGQPASGQAQLTGSQDFLIGLGVGALAVIVVGALTFEVWGPKVAARIARSAGKGLIGGLGGTAGKGILGFGIINLGAMGGGAGRGQILSAGAGGRGIIDKIPRPLKGLYRP